MFLPRYFLILTAFPLVASTNGWSLEVPPTPTGQPMISHLGIAGFEVEAVTLERDKNGEFKADSVAKWAALASQGFRVTQSVADNGRLVLVLERNVSGAADVESYIPSAVRSDPLVAEQLARTLRANRPVTLVVNLPPAPVPLTPNRNGPEGHPRVESAPTKP